MKEELVIDKYFNLTKEYREKYPNSKVAILMQVGSFYEVYGYEKNNIIDSTYSEIDDISKICDFSIANKKNIDENSRYIMSGFPDLIGLDKYVQLLLKSNYIVPVYNQIKDKTGKVLERVCENIYSPGTYVNASLNQQNKITNNIMCLWFQKYKKPFGEYLKIGGAVMNMYSSDTYLFEYDKKWVFDTTTFDELDNYLRIYQPHELIIINNLENNEIDDIVSFCGIQNIHIHKFNLDNEIVKNAEKQTYQKYIIEKLHGSQSYDYCFEFRKLFAIQTYCFLLNFLEKYNKSHLDKIKFPVFENNNNKMVLANHTLMQLNILSLKEEYGKVSSVMSLLNKTRTCMGRRMFQNQLCNPSFDENWLNNEYKYIKLFIKKPELVQDIRKQLTNIIDIEKFARKVVNGNIVPSDFCKFYKGVLIIKNLNVKLKNKKYRLYNYLLENESKEVLSVFENLIEKMELWIKRIFDIEKCGSINRLHDVNCSFFADGAFETVDEVNHKYIEKRDELYNSMEELFGPFYVKKEEKKEEIYFTLTEKRSKEWKVQNKELKKDFDFKKATGSNVRICGKYDKLCIEVMSLKLKLIDITKEEFRNVLPVFIEEFNNDIIQMSKFVSKLDVLMNKVYISHLYNYCEPIIQDNDKSFVKAENLRHCLIEHIQKNETYVGNNIELGTDQSGILLYGTNAAGKTSLIRALGISIIMAQSGMFVPCSAFTFKPYQSLYSRILNHDNLFRGLSTFAVEMSELRVIINDATENSLILGDELCSGTEMQSALGIITAGLITLHEKNSSFIFATHFHEVVDLEEIQQLEKLKFYHLTVRYNYETEKLEYDRKLKEGSGERVYGLEVCKSLYMPNEFVNLACQIRNKYYPETQGFLNYKPSKYNKNVLRGLCEICNKKMSTETHHIKQQKDADENGFIEGFHKNHSANLMALCEECHLKQHH